MGPSAKAANIARQHIQEGVVAGILNNGKKGYPRLEIDDFCQDYARLNLYLLAMSAIQDPNNDIKDLWSWFQIQGIHGVPWADWGGIGPEALYKDIKSRGHQVDITSIDGQDPREGDREVGYCTHGTILFPSWHRGYAAMIEQAIQAKMVEIASTFKRKGPNDLASRSRSAAIQFRQPYWDPFRARAGQAWNNTLQPGLSLILAVKRVKVTRPDLTEAEIDNPLYSYKFPGRDKFINARPALLPRIEGNEWAGLDIRTRETHRRPPDPNNPISSNNVAIQRRLEGSIGDSAGTLQWRDLMEKAYHTLMLDSPQQVPNAKNLYHRFATNDWERAEQIALGVTQLSPNGDPHSLEAWHNEMHGIIGGQGGTMGNPDTAGHDPIFIFHHANVDRHYALWQARYPKEWWGAAQAAATENNYTQLLGTYQTPQTPLIPFRRKPPTIGQNHAQKNTFWNTDDIRDHSTLGYQYNPIPTDMSPNERSREATRDININLAWYKARPTALDGPFVDPVPMDKVKAFLSWPPRIDDRTDQNPLWTPITATPGPLHPNRLPIRRQLRAEGSVGDSSVLLPVPAPEFAKLPDSDFEYIFPPSTISSAGYVKLWFFNFRCLRHTLGTSFTVYVFLGDFPTSSSEWSKAPNLVMPLFQIVRFNPAAFEATPDSGPATQSGAISPEDGTLKKLVPKVEKEKHSTCGNCARQQEDRRMLADTAPLTQSLLKYIRLGEAVPDADDIEQGDLPGVAVRSLESDDVVPFLKRNLHWRVVRSDGEEIPRDQLEEFKVFVTQRGLTLPKNNFDVPIYDPAELKWDVTDNRPGGLASGEHP
ncbi:Di-copper centre-containing protein [Patellaria atrata CBS 101060]|uniref:tyrosinase n=1 Tax=Patellaria atrata CBS 101060 TaxID=1346257 RepID=A0A9P4SB82_9PEZI|nr:Di-copper centre-containing protein [Patellaria atrata CBS 101060]